MRKIHLIAGVLALSWAAVVQAQVMPDWAKGATAQQVSTFNSVRAGLQKRLKLSTSMLDAISRIVGTDYKSGKFLDLLQDLKERAELAGKLQLDLVAMRSSVQRLPSGPTRTSAALLIAAASADLAAGRLGPAEDKLGQVVVLRWGNSGSELALWMQSVVAQSNVVLIRRGADAAVDVLGSARAGLMSNTVQVDTQLLLKQADVYLAEKQKRGTRAPLDKALALIDDGISRLDSAKYPSQFSALQLKKARFLHQLTSWDNSARAKADAALGIARAGIKTDDREAYRELLETSADFHYIYNRFDQAIATADQMIELGKAQQDTDLIATALHWRAMAEGQRARELQGGSPLQSAWYAASLRDYQSSIAFRSQAGKPSSGTRINLVLARIGMAMCCAAPFQKLRQVEGAVAEITGAEHYWSKVDDPASWHHVQTIIGSSYRTLAALRYQEARLSRNKPSITQALREMQLARRYYVNGSQFMNEINAGEYHAQSVATQIKEIDAEIQLYQQALALLH